MGGYIGNLFGAIWESYGDDDSQWKWEPYLLAFRKKWLKQFVRHGVTKTPNFQKYQYFLQKNTFLGDKT